MSEQKPLHLDSLERITMRLQEALTEYVRDPENPFILDAVVKRFEITFELSRKLLRRFLIDLLPEVAKIAPDQLHEFVRLGEEQELLKSSWQVWRALRDARNKTAHDYGEEMAREIAAQAVPMLAEALFLLETLRRRTLGHDH